MSTEVIMPKLGMSQETGRVVKWHRAEGEPVTKGEVLLEVETDKAVVEIEAPATGVLAQVAAKDGDEVPVGDVIAIISAESGAARPDAVGPASGPSRSGSVSPGVRASPHVRGLARERGIDLRTVRGTGPGGAIKEADLTPAPGAPKPARRGIWSTMARRTAQSWTVPHFYLHREVDAGKLKSWREHAAGADASVTFTDLLVRVVAACLRRHPLANGTWDGESAVESAAVAIGIAVAVDDGLVVPVIRRADELSLREITARRRELVERARSGKLQPADLEGGTFTISNLGMYAVDSFDAIVNGPQAVILATGRIADRVVAVGGVPQVRPMMSVTVSCDHRAIDGARAAAFLTDLGDLIEEPAALL